ncbi:MAG: hypothetical protein HYX32_07100 [Actinobacteria bacterium]|nr:hypothetical protein [Actinomycetota bacterium]
MIAALLIIWGVIVVATIGSVVFLPSIRAGRVLRAWRNGSDDELRVALSSCPNLSDVDLDLVISSSGTLPGRPAGTTMPSLLVVVSRLTIAVISFKPLGVGTVLCYDSPKEVSFRMVRRVGLGELREEKSGLVLSASEPVLQDLIAGLRSSGWSVADD